MTKSTLAYPITTAQIPHMLNTGDFARPYAST
jgi:hypothetical protein